MRRIMPLLLLLTACSGAGPVTTGRPTSTGAGAPTPAALQRTEFGFSVPAGWRRSDTDGGGSAKEHTWTRPDGTGRVEFTEGGGEVTAYYDESNRPVLGSPGQDDGVLSLVTSCRPLKATALDPYTSVFSCAHGRGEARILPFPNGYLLLVVLGASRRTSEEILRSWTR